MALCRRCPWVRSQRDPGGAEQRRDLDGVHCDAHPVLLQQGVNEVADKSPEVLGQRDHLAPPVGEHLPVRRKIHPRKIRPRSLVHQPQGEDIGNGEPRQAPHLTSDKRPLDAARLQLAPEHPLDVRLW